LNRVTEDEKAIEIGKVLGHWNPLGDGATAAKDFANVLHRSVETAAVLGYGSTHIKR
jgi:hypothetical protein